MNREQILIDAFQSIVDEGYDAYDTSHHLVVQRWFKIASEALKSARQSPSVDADELTIDDYKEVFEDHKKLVRELDVIINGENAAKQASLCDIVSQVRGAKWQSSNERHELQQEVERLKLVIKRMWLQLNPHTDFFGHTDGESYKEQERFWQKYLNNL